MKTFSLREWQIPAVEHILENPHCAIWMDLGLGKTSAVLCALQRLNFIREVYPAIIVAPLRVAQDTWPEEVGKWQEFRNIKISAVVGELDERMSALQKSAHIYTVNYEQLEWLIALYGKKWPFRTVVIDESTRVKSTRVRQGGVRGGLLYKVCQLPIVQQVIELTGLCAPNGLKDLYGQMLFLDNGDRLGRTFDSFEKRWFRPSYDGYGLEPFPFAQKEIQERIQDICLSIRAEDYFDLRAPIELPVPVELPPAARRLYKDMERNMFMVIEQEGVEAFNAAGRRNKCSQIADGFAYVGEDTKEWKPIHTEKIKALESIIEESAGMPLLTAYHFKASLQQLTKAFPKAADISKKDGLAKFKEGKLSAGFAHPASMGHGIDGLQLVTNRMCYFSHNDNYDNYKQIQGRIGPVRQFQAGLNRPVFIYHIVATNTVEEYAILPNLQGKGALNDLLRAEMRRQKR